MAEHPRILSVIGARPEIVQAAPVSAAFAACATEILVHTGQHYDAAMSGDQITATGLREPDHNLGVGSMGREEQVALGQERILAVIEQERPDAVLVRGDTNATLSGARAAAAAGVPLLHVEAGLRSWRDDMPEEHNRIETDRLSDVLFAPSPAAARTLAEEGVRGEVFVTGDPMCDILQARRAEVEPAEGEYLLATVHRNYNTDDPDRLRAVLDCLSRSPWEVRFPVHPRTRARIDGFGLEVPANVRLLPPADYIQMLSLERGAQAIATDSGGVQREAYLWAVPCVTLREETEWLDTVETGWNTLVGVDPERFAAALDRPRPAEHPPVLGDGNAAQRIASLTVGWLADDLERAA